jgi:RNA polymerase sigma factor (sigma-70 family)
MDLLELVQKAQSGDKAAFYEVCQRFAGLVGKHSHQAHIQVIWEDAQAEGWLAVAQAVRTYDPASGVPFPGYAESRVKYAVWNLFKRERRRWQQEFSFGESGEEDEWDLLAALADDTNIALAVETRILGEEAGKALQDLPEKQRQVVFRTVLQESSLTEIAQEMGVTVQAVYNLRQRGLARLKTLCSRMCRSERG